MGIEMIDLEFVFFAVSALAIAVACLTLVPWVVIMKLYLEEMDYHFDSPDFPNRGVKGIWPFGSGRALTYGVFLVFHNTRFVRKKFPHARESIDIDKLPKKIKFMVLFPMYTYVPSALFVLLAGAILKINKWFF